MSVREELATVIARYDEDAWVALANRGLLRRAQKDLSTLEIWVVEETAETVEIAVGERRVRMGSDGPAGAACDCPSPVICQHILTAGLWLAQAADVSSGPNADQLHEQLMAIDEQTLTSYAGLAGFRWAYQYLRDLEQAPQLLRGEYLSITLTQPEVVVRYLGGGLDGLVLDQKVSSAQRYRVAAVLAWQQGHGLEIVPPPVRTRVTGPTEAGLSLEDSRSRLRAAVRALLTDVVRIGVSHLSPGVLERFTTAAVWAQGAEYHRLARMLRQLTDQVDLQLARSAAANDLQLLESLVNAFALTSALEAAGGEAAASLIGRARGSYDELRTLDLLGLGGYPWRSGGGYHGLTTVFWSPGKQRYFTWTDTRPETLMGFDPRQRWQQPAPWTGLATPASAAGRLLLLTAAKVTVDARISGVESTAARSLTANSAQFIEQLVIHERWSDLAQAAGRGRSLLAQPDPNAAWAVLRPAAFGTPWYDRAEQSLQWAVFDVDGASLSLELPWSQLHAHAIGRIETLEDLAEETLVVARLQRRQGRLVGFPLSLIRPGQESDPIDNLHFDPGVRESELVTALKRAGIADVDEGHTPPATGMPVALADLRATVEQFAQRGTEGGQHGAVHAELVAAHRALRDIGWLAFSDPDPTRDSAELLIRSHHLVLQAEQLLAG